MFRSYFRSAFRNFVRFKTFSILNVAGLAIGLSVSLLILMYVYDELSYDRYHTKADNIYRLTRNLNTENTAFATSFAPMADFLLNDYLDIVTPVRFYKSSSLVHYDLQQQFQENNFFYADSTVFSVFDFNLVQGDKNTALEKPFSLVITKSTAQKYFPNENPMGKILTVDNEYEFLVTGVLEDVPRNSHFSFDFLGSFVSLYQVLGRRPLENRWYPSMYTYVYIPNKDLIPEMEREFPDKMVKFYNGEWARNGHVVTFQPLNDIHLRSHLEEEIEQNGKVENIVIFVSIAFFILLTACINFMNLITARSVKRAREVGLRKVLGAHRSQIMMQFFGESFYFTIISFFAAYILIFLFLPSFNSLTGKDFSIGLHNLQGIIAASLVITLFVGFLSGSYPSIYLSSFIPVKVLQGRISGNGASLFRRVLVVLQFCITIGLIFSTIVINNQMDFVETKELGFNKEDVLIIPLRGNEVADKYKIIKNSLLQNSSVVSVSLTSEVVGESKFGTYPVRFEGVLEDNIPSMTVVSVDQDFIDVMDIELLAGRNFSNASISDNRNSYILNEAAVNRIGWESPLNKKFMIRLNSSGYGPGNVIGVIKDFHFRSLHRTIEPLILNVRPEWYSHVLIRTMPGSISDFVESYSAAWAKLIPERPFEYTFLDETFDKIYKPEQRLGLILEIFSIISVSIACLGLFGLSAFTAERRIKEIGIRKVFGASTGKLIFLLNEEFIRLTLISCAVVLIPAYLAMNQWLQNFAYRTSIEPEDFVFAVLLTVIITLITVSYQSIKAAYANPVDSLRNE